MWVAEFKVWHEGSPLLPLSERLDVHAYSTYLNSFKERGKAKVMRLAVFWGKDKEKAIQAMYAHPGTEVISREGDQLVFSQKAIRSFHTIVSDKTAFFLGPILEEKGFQWWKVGSNQKENLIHLFRRIKKLKGYAKVELVRIKNQKLQTLSFNPFSELQGKDLEWWKAALREGYYEYPRKISLKQLGEKLGVPFSTLKDRLRKAELHIMKKAGQGL